MIQIKRNGEGRPTNLIPPDYQKVCNVTDDYFDLIKHCWECVGIVNHEISHIDVYRGDSIYELGYYKSVMLHLHRRINECYEHLKSIDNEKDISHVTDVFTTSIAHKGK